jgi:opacity protein-like surface antigen
VTFPNGSSNLSARAATFNTSLNRSGIIYGGQAGHNWLLHNIFSTWDGVLGVEVDFQGKSDSKSATYSSETADPNFPGFPMNQTYTQTDRISTLGTLRGRAGVLWGPSTLIYATAGVAWASVRTSSNYLQNENDAPASASSRFAVVTASGRSLPARMCSSEVGTVSKMTCIWPPSISVIAGAEPR